MRRREFITLLGSAAGMWPSGARAQQPGVPVIGYLSTNSPEARSLMLGQHSLRVSLRWVTSPGKT